MIERLEVAEEESEEREDSDAGAVAVAELDEEPVVVKPALIV